MASGTIASDFGFGVLDAGFFSLRYMKKVIILAFIFVAVGLAFRWYVQQQASQAILGIDLTYILQPNGDAFVEQASKVYFTSPETEGRFADLEKRGASALRTDATARSMSNLLKNLSDKTGRTMMAKDFSARLERTTDYGAQVISFRWTAFAAYKDGIWLVDYSFADKIVMNEHSALIVVLPAEAELIVANPPPSERQGSRLIWHGPVTMPWPRIEYRLP